MKRMTIFAWGYWGWGTHTAEFVQAVDAIERRRGKRPPIFADIRISRSVRAPGFRGGALAMMVGQSRYRWIKKLGNDNVRTKKRGVKIADPAGIDDLLQLVVDADRQKRRVIFFCSCEVPCRCHRTDVAKLLHKTATRKRMLVKVVEWPGGEPEAVRLAVSSKTIQGALRGANRISLEGASVKTLRQLVSLPWCSRVDLRSGDTALGIVSGPARLATGWYLPVIGAETSKKTDTVRSLKAKANRLRNLLGYAARY